MMKKIKLGEVLDVKRGTSLSGKYYKTEGDYIRLTLGNFNYPSSGWKENKSKDNLYYDGSITPEYIMSKGDIITPLTEQVRGLLGNTATVPEDNLYIQSGDIGKVIPHSDVLYGRFAYYLISSRIVKKQLDACAQQTKIRHTSPDKIKNCAAFIPDKISEQIKIASILDAINSKIELNNRINDNLQQLLSLIINRHLCNAKDKKTVALKKLVKRINIPIDSIIRKIPTVDLSVMPSGSFSLSQLNDSANFESNLTEMKEGNILFGSIRPYLKKAGIAPCNGAVTGTIYQYEILDERFYNLILYSLTSQQIFDYATKSSHGTKMPVVNSDRLLEYPIEYTEELLDDIEILNLKDIIVRNCKENSNLTKLRDFLLPLLMNGQATID